MNQVGCACAYVYDCCKLLRVFSAPVYPDRRRRLSILSSSSSSFRLLFLFPSFSSCFSLFFLSYLSVSALVRFFFYRPAALASSEGCTSSSGHRTSCSSNRRRRLAIKLYSISWTPRRAFREALWRYLFVGLY